MIPVDYPEVQAAIDSEMDELMSIYMEEVVR